LAYRILKYVEYILNILQNTEIHFVSIYSFGSLQTLSNKHCLLSVYDLHLSPVLDSIKSSPVVSHATDRSKQGLLRALLSPVLGSISGDMFVTTPTLVMGTDQFPKTWGFEQFTTVNFLGQKSV